MVKVIHPIKFTKYKKKILYDKGFVKHLSPKILRTGNKLSLLFSGTLNQDNVSSIYNAKTEGSVKKWELDKNPILNPIGDYSNQRLLSPEIIRLDNNTHRMIVVGVSYPTKLEKLIYNNRLNSGNIISFISTDLKQWTCEHKSILLGKLGKYGYGTPFLLRDNKNILFFHKRTNYSYDIWQGDYNIENNYIDKKSIKNVITHSTHYDKFSLYSPHIIQDSSGYHMYYSGWGGDPVKGRIFYAYSKDLSTWVKYDKPVIEPDYDLDNYHCSEPCIYYDEKKWHLFYEGCGSDNHWRVLYCYSN